MKCMECGKKVQKDDSVCPHCGKALAPEAMDTQELMDTMGEIHNELDKIGEMRERRKTNKRNTLIVLLVIVLCLAAGFGTMYYFKSKGETEPVNSEAQPAVSSAVAGETVKKFMGENFVNVDITDENSAQTAIETVQTQLGIASDNLSFRLIRKTQISGDTYYRFAQMYNGIDVYGGEAILLVSADGKPMALHANLIETTGLDTVASLEPAKASNAINEYVNKMVEEYRVKDGIQISEPTKVVCNFEGKTYLAYTSNVSGYNGKGVYVGYDVFVDADNGAGIFVFNTASFENGDAAEDAENTENTEEAAEEESVPVSDATGYTIFSVNDKFGWNVTDKAGATEELPLADIEAGNATKYVSGIKSSIDHAYNYFDKTFGWTGLDGKDGAFSVYLSANDYVKDTIPPEQALYHNDILMFIEQNMAESKPDENVVVHEYAHGVMHHIAGLAGTDAKHENAAIAEALADVFAEFAEGDAPDWKHKDRNFSEVQAGYFYEAGDGVEILTMLDSYRYSTVISRATYKMFAEGIGTKKLGELYFRSLLMMTRYDTFRDFGAIVEMNANLMKQTGTLSDTQFEIVTTALTNAGIRGEKLYQSEVAEIEDGEILDEDEEDPNEKVID